MEDKFSKQHTFGKHNRQGFHTQDEKKVRFGENKIKQFFNERETGIKHNNQKEYNLPLQKNKPRNDTSRSKSQKNNRSFNSTGNAKSSLERAAENKNLKAYDSIGSTKLLPIKKGMFSYPKKPRQVQNLVTVKKKEIYEVHENVEAPVIPKTEPVLEEHRFLKTNSSKSFKFDLSHFKIGQTSNNNSISSLGLNHKHADTLKPDSSSGYIDEYSEPFLVPSNSEPILPHSESEIASRRMLIEFLKTQLKVQKHLDVRSLLSHLNIDPEILNYRKFTQKPKKEISHKNFPEEIVAGIPKSMEIKNNNFEINNNFYGNFYNKDTSQSNYQKKGRIEIAEDVGLYGHSEEKQRLLNFALTPRILVLQHKSSKIPFMFSLSPSEISLGGIEHYFFEWLDLSTLKTVDRVDILSINYCAAVQNNAFQIYMDSANLSQRLKDPIVILTKSSEISNFYVSALNYVSQLAKCKFYSLKADKMYK